MNGLMLLIGVFMGGIAAWILANLSCQKKLLTERGDIEAKVVSAESTAAVLRQQVEDLKSQAERVRQELIEEQRGRVSAETKLAETTKNLEEQKQLLDKAEEKLSTTFQALSGEALKSNNQAFLELAKESLNTVLSDAKGDLGQRQEAIRNLVAPLEKALGQYQGQVSELDRLRSQSYGELKQQIASLAQTEERLQKEAENLVSALRLPQVRGRWGEMTLKRVLELAGMSEHCDYVEQVSIQTEDGRLQPDLIIHMPGKHQLVVDAKTPLSAYLDAIETKDEAVRRSSLNRHAQQLRDHMVKLSSKAYWNQFPQAPEYVIMFVPGESFFNAALECDRTLIEDGISSRVLLATPISLIALLRAIAQGWRQEQVAKNAQIIAELGKEVYRRFQTFLDHVGKTRKDLEQTVFSFNRMVGSIEGRVLPGVRRFRELGATSEGELPIIEPIEQIPRELTLQQDSKETDGS